MELLRAAPVARKMELIAGINAMLSNLALAGLKARHPEADAAELRYRLDALRLGDELARQLREARVRRRDNVRGREMPMAADPIPVIMAVIGALERLGVPYYLGGSFASGAHGVYRATADADIVADLREEQVDMLARQLQDGFYADAAMMRDAILHRSSFNLLHYDTGFKVDIFIPKRRAFDRAQIERRRRHALAAGDESGAYVSSVEGTILAQLERYCLGNEVSERQWSDVLGMLKVQAGALDLAYLRHWAGQLGLTDLLERAFQDAGIP